VEKVSDFFVGREILKGVWGVFGGTKTPKHQLKKGARNPKNRAV
jgi:hypothetical protein